MLEPRVGVCHAQARGDRKHEPDVRPFPPAQLLPQGRLPAPRPPLGLPLRVQLPRLRRGETQQRAECLERILVFVLVLVFRRWPVIFFGAGARRGGTSVAVAVAAAAAALLLARRTSAVLGASSGGGGGGGGGCVGSGQLGSYAGAVAAATAAAAAPAAGLGDDAERVACVHRREHSTNLPRSIRFDWIGLDWIGFEWIRFHTKTVPVVRCIQNKQHQTNTWGADSNQQQLRHLHAAVAAANIAGACNISPKPPPKSMNNPYYQETRDAGVTNEKIES